MTNNIGFKFPPDDSQQWEGFNSSGVEHFAGKPLIALGREILQNSLDAGLDNQKPVRVEIDTIEIPISEVPDVEALRMVIGHCANASYENNPKADAFFLKARELLQDTKIKVLRISDYNTTGLAGPCIKGTPYFAFMKAQGVSAKQGDESLGSYGIGKFAPFAVSMLRTVFVSTIWDDGGTFRHYSQGKVLVRSHEDSEHRVRRSTGFWGEKEHYQPVEGFDLIPDWLKRCSGPSEAASHIGTTVFVLGFRPNKNWKYALTGAIVENFFGAIERGRMEVAVADIKINRDTLAGIFTNDLIRSATLELTDEQSDFENSRCFLEALSNKKETIVEQHENQHLGLCELRLIVREGLPRKVAILRDGMFITDELAKLKRFPDFKEFVAIVECKAAKGNKLLRAMEPPAHDAFEFNRLPDEQIQAGKVALNDLGRWVRDAIGKRARHPASEVTNIDELKDFFADELEGAAGGAEREEDPFGRIKIQLRATQKPKRLSPSEDVNERPRDDGEGGGATETNGGTGTGDDDGGSTGGDVSETKEKRPTGGGPGGGDGGAKKQMPIPVYGTLGLSNVRAIPLGPSQRRLSFTPSKTCRARLMVEDSGADTNHKLQIKSATQGTVVQGLIDGLDLTADVRCTIEINFEGNFLGTMRVIADAI